MIFTFRYLTLNEAERLPGKATLTVLSGHQRYNLAIKEKVTMNIVEFSILTFLGSVTAGFLGALTGLGGGVVIIPLLTLVFGVDIRYAIGASLVSVIATSSGAAAAYVKKGFSNIRLGMFLEMATTFGALFGAAIAARISTQAIAVIFGIVLLYSAFLSVRGHTPGTTVTEDTRHFLPSSLHLDAAYPGSTGPVSYHVNHVPTGFSLMFLAGTLSGLLGIGSGAVKVLAMDQAMSVPFKVSTTTSNFMIGVTAAASASVYLNRGYIDPGLAMPVMLGVVLGSILGSQVLIISKTRPLRIIFAGIILILGLEMIYNGIAGRL